VTGKVTEYTYNALDLIEKVTDNGTVTAEYSYYPDGSISSSSEEMRLPQKQRTAALSAIYVVMI